MPRLRRTAEDRDLDAIAKLARRAWSRRSLWEADLAAFRDDQATVELAGRMRRPETTDDDLQELAEWAVEHAPTGADLVLVLLVVDSLPPVGERPGLRSLLLSAMRLGAEPLVPVYAQVVLSALEGIRPPALHDLVCALPPAWLEHSDTRSALLARLLSLLEAGDAVDPDRLTESWQGGVSPVVAVLDRLAEALGEAGTSFRDAALRAALRSSVEFARIVDAAALGPAGLVETAELSLLADEIADLIDRDPPGSVLVSGDAGSGRSTLIALAARRLAARGWTAIEATPDDVAAGQIYVNQLDGRLTEMAEAIRGRRVVWIAPGFDSALTSGRTSSDPRSFVDRLAPLLARGSVSILGEIGTESLQALPRECPALAKRVFSTSPPRLSQDELLAVGRSAVEAAGRSEGVRPAVRDAFLAEAADCARHLLGYLALPGSFARLLSASVRIAAVRADGGQVVLRRDDLLAALSSLTGMPRAVLDESEPLDTDALRGWFAERVLGQSEAVDALVERIALVKAGLCDPQRPYGTFLFVGPTGTGKTEIARSLAEQLFGSPERLLRIDMSELKTPDSLDRLIGAGEVGGVRSLASQIRAEPFSVVLLDEFEKAAPEVWDLFLQVFDAGRLTDRAGRTADFRQAIVIVTSNLGSAIDSPRALGFGEAARADFSEERVLKAVRSALRPELVNRFDRVVVFRPLSRGVMRGIVHHEVRAALGRRGIAQREWAIEVDESAIDFLLERGFTADLGARPLKRAVERHLLVPIAEAIVSHRAPGGEQFLLLGAAENRMDVEFVAANAEPEAPAIEAEATRPISEIARIVVEARGRRSDLHAIRDELENLRALTREAPWQEWKSLNLSATSEPGFWSDPRRFEALSRAETLDSIEAQLRSAASVLQRLYGLVRDDETRIDAGPVGRLARDLVQLRHAIASATADEPQDAIVEIACEEGGEALAPMLGEMYLAWARSARGTVRAAARSTDPWMVVLVVEALGAYRALAPETGFHVLEETRGSRVRRLGQVRVVVTPWHALPGDDPIASARERRDAAAAIVRRYQLVPTPLVRDQVRGYRTGRIERVLGGAFDVL